MHSLDRHVGVSDPRSLVYYVHLTQVSALSHGKLSSPGLVKFELRFGVTRIVALQSPQPSAVLFVLFAGIRTQIRPLDTLGRFLSSLELIEYRLVGEIHKSVFILHRISLVGDRKS